MSWRNEKRFLRLLQRLRLRLLLRDGKRHRCGGQFDWHRQVDVRRWKWSFFHGRSGGGGRSLCKSTCNWRGGMGCGAELAIDSDGSGTSDYEDLVARRDPNSGPGPAGGGRIRPLHGCTAGRAQGEESGGAIKINFEAPPATFVISPNFAVRQIWISALSTSFKLDWSAASDAFLLEKTGENLKALISRLVNQQLGQELVALS